MNYGAGMGRIAGYRKEIAELREKMRAAQAEIEPQEVRDNVFSSLDGPRQLSDLFGGRDDLILIHNMGKKCPACTLWADGFNGVYPHLADRAAFVVTSPDSPAVQQEFARSRGWRFPMFSHEGTSFAADMGYHSERGYKPGVSVFRKDGKQILRVGDTRFNPFDDFAGIWHLFDMLPGGAGGWMPKLTY
ncbi:MAG TPA: DUF899 family protein [Alphaproteobacteria bacterium]|nr:DUF899 family protein [Alphaproteobacteria bacterium]